jgi:hypothetical protein
MPRWVFAWARNIGAVTSGQPHERRADGHDFGIGEAQLAAGSFLARYSGRTLEGVPPRPPRLLLAARTSSQLVVAVLPSSKDEASTDV